MQIARWVNIVLISVIQTTSQRAAVALPALYPTAVTVLIVIYRVGIVAVQLAVPAIIIMTVRMVKNVFINLFC